VFIGEIAVQVQSTVDDETDEQKDKRVRKFMQNVYQKRCRYRRVIGITRNSELIADPFPVRRLKSALRVNVSSVAVVPDAADVGSEALDIDDGELVHVVVALHVFMLLK
jgi:hypothetical protein